MKTGVQPGLQTGLGRRQIHTGYADLGESQFATPILDLRNQLIFIQSAFDQPVQSHPPIVETTPRTLVWASEDDTLAFATRLAACPALRNAFVELEGDLGAGKTTLVRHLLRALGVQGRIKSPTYAVVEPHEVPGPAPLLIWHFDFYRFNDPREWEDAGFRDIFASPGLKLAEWPEKARASLPPCDLAIKIEVFADESRRVQLQAGSANGRELLACLG